MDTRTLIVPANKNATTVFALANSETGDL
jgi:hypothetical protein